MRGGWRWRKDAIVLSHAQQSCLQLSFLFALKFLESVWQIVYMGTRLKNVLLSEGVTP